MRYEVSEFNDAEDKIASIRPDIVILDLLAGGGSAQVINQGRYTLDFIWDKHFCPVVVYSAQPDIIDNKYKKHPFVKRIKKGAGSDRKVVRELTNLRPQINALKEAEEPLRRSFSDAMREVAPYAFTTFTDDTQRIRRITRSGRRRLAALMDESSADESVLASWEQYLFPPVHGDIQLGDVLKKRRGPRNDPYSFRVVLTPSCDLVSSGKRIPKAKKILAARCCSMKEGLELTSLKDVVGRPPKLKERLRSAILTQGYLEAVIPFPGLQGQIPTMAANLRDLELIDNGKVGDRDTDGPFVRIASIDSPFRELVAWAYLQIACRPGLPDRDFNSWRDEIVEDVKQANGGKGT